MADFWEYPTSYNGTNVSSASDFFLGYPAYITGISSNVLIVFVFAIFLALGLPFGMGAAVVSSSFITFILSTFLWWNGTLGMIYPIAFLGLTIAGAIIVGNSR